MTDHNMSVEYIEEHQLTLIDAEAFGRITLYQILEAAKGSKSSAVSTKFSVHENKARGCVTVCGFGVCIHVST